MKRILACVDGSEQSRWGAVLSVQLAARMDAAVTLVHAIVPLQFPDMPASASPARREHERKILESLMQNLGAASVSASVLVGPPAEVISEAAKDEDVVLVVAGVRGRGLSRLFLGRVYVAPEPLKHGPEPFTFDVVEWELEHKEMATRFLREASAREARVGLVIETELLKGPAADRLADLAKAPQVAMVAVGHRGRGAIKRLLLGSVADRLAQLSPKPVLIVR